MIYRVATVHVWHDMREISKYDLVRCLVNGILNLIPVLLLSVKSPFRDHLVLKPNCTSLLNSLQHPSSSQPCSSPPLAPERCFLKCPDPLLISKHPIVLMLLRPELPLLLPLPPSGSSCSSPRLPCCLSDYTTFCFCCHQNIYELPRLLLSLSRPDVGIPPCACTLLL